MSSALLRHAVILLTAAIIVSCATAPRPSTRAVAPRREVDVLINRVLEAYGGRERLARATTRRDEGRVVTIMDSKEGQYLRAFRRPDHLRVEIHYPDHSELRILAGQEGWRGDDRSPPAATKGPMLTAMAMQASRLNLPWILEDHRNDARLAASDDNTLAVEVTLAPGQKLTAIVDRKTGRILRSVSILEGPPMPLTFATEYADFRMVDGVLVPFSEENFASGTHTATTTLERVVSGGPMGDELFRP